MQPEDAERMRISYYHDVAVGWMQNPAVDVLSCAQIGVPRFARRVDGRSEACSTQDNHPHNQCVHSYDFTGVRPACPPKPLELSWGTRVDGGCSGETKSTLDVIQETPAPEAYSENGRVGTAPFGVYRPPTPPHRRSIFTEDAVPVAVPDGNNNVRIEYVAESDIRASIQPQRGRAHGAPTCDHAPQPGAPAPGAIISTKLPEASTTPAIHDTTEQSNITLAPSTPEPPQRHMPSNPATPPKTHNRSRENTGTVAQATTETVADGPTKITDNSVSTNARTGDKEVFSRTSGDDSRAETPHSEPTTLFDSCAQEKPRAFQNIGLSCWINASLQALFAPPIFKNMLQRKCNLRATFLAPLLQDAQARQHYLVKFPVRPGFRHEDRLAVMFQMASREPLTQTVVPHLFTDHFYEPISDVQREIITRHRQEDACELIARLLDYDETPILYTAAKGHMDQTLHCRRPGCHGMQPSTGEDFVLLPVPLKLASGHLCTDVQDALNEYMPDETAESNFAWRCPSCSTTSPPPLKRQRPSSLPKVLVIQLNRWSSAHAAGALLHPVEANATIQFHGITYDLQSVVVHLGATPDSGHYITVARHETNNGNWWVYDDSRRVHADDAQITTLAMYSFGGGMAQMKSYILFYSRR